MEGCIIRQARRSVNPGVTLLRFRQRESPLRVFAARLIVNYFTTFEKNRRTPAIYLVESERTNRSHLSDRFAVILLTNAKGGYSEKGATTCIADCALRECPIRPDRFHCAVLRYGLQRLLL